jgi:hypothetical protein
LVAARDALRAVDAGLARRPLALERRDDAWRRAGAACDAAFGSDTSAPAVFLVGVM